MTTAPPTDVLRETLVLFDESGPPLSTPEVADRLDLGRRSTYDRLERLVDHGLLETKKVGANARVWWRPTDESAASRADERALREGSDQFQALVEAVEEYAIFMLDADGRIQTWNPGAERIKGYERHEIVGEHFSTFYTEEDRRAGVPEGNLADAAADGVVTDEGWRVRADGTTFWAHVTITAVEDQGGDPSGYAKVTRDMTDRREREQAVRHERDLLDRILETSPIGIGVFRPDGSVDRMNERMSELLWLPDDGADGAPLGDAEMLDPSGEPLAFEDSPAGQAAETGDPVVDREVQVEGADGSTRWISVDAARFSAGDHDGLVVATARDVTHRREQARRLERQRDDLKDELDEMYERIDDAFYALDEQFRFTYVNERAEELLGRDEDELLGEVVWDAFPRATDTVAWERFHRALEEQESTSFVDYMSRLGFWIEAHVYPSETGLSVYFRDVTEQKARERKLQEYERIVETVDDGIYLVDSDGRFTMVNEAYAEMTGYSREELVGMTVEEVVDEDTVERALAHEEELIAGERETARFEADVRTAEGGSFRGEGVFSIIEHPEGGHQRVGAVRDITERKERERELQARVEQQEAVTELSRRALEGPDLDALLAEASERVARTLDNDFCKVLDLDADAEELLLRQGVGWDDGVVGSATVSAVEDDSQAAYTLGTHDPVVVEDLETESRFGGPDLLTDHGVRSGISVIVGPLDDPWGILGTHDRAAKQFAGHDVSFVQSVANILAAAIERHDYEQELLLQRERLAALDDLNRVVRDLTDAAIDQSTRAEIEQVVCDDLAASESYEFAWIGDVDPETQTMNVRAETGAGGYLDGVTISVDPDDPRSDGPTGRAVRTNRMQVTEDVLEDESFERWRDRAEEYGVRSSAAIPVIHEDVRFGVINVYADRPHAFTGDERSVVEHLGEVVGHAIAAVERKRALTSDEIVALEFEVPGVFDALDIPRRDGRLSLDRAVPVGDGHYLAYGVASGDMLDVLQAAVESLPHWESARVLGDDEGDGATRFELQLDDPPVLSTVTALGGYVDRAVLEDGDYAMRIHLAPSADVRRLIDLVREAYPMARMVSRRQVARDAGASGPFLSVVSEHLTDRQRSALEAAYFAGYFEWPRDVNGEEVADVLGVSAPTFHQHLRKAQQKLLRVALADSASD